MSTSLTRRGTFVGAALLSSAAAIRPARAAAPDIDSLVAGVMGAFEVPGMAVALVRGTTVEHARGYGVRRLGEPGAVTDRTAFALASCSKAFTAAALGMLVEEGRLRWDDPVADRLPGFAMSDPQVTAGMTVRDLLLHRSGLPLGAGDLMTWPETTHSRAEIVAGLRHLPLVRPFRSGYDYDNVLYIAAGELVAAVSGRSWEAFVSERILRPLGMSDSGPTADPRWLPSADVAWPHTRLSPAGRGVGPQRPLARSGRGRVNNGPAGGVRTSARDVARWLQLQIGWGQAPGAPRLWSDETAYELWKARTLIRDEGGSSPAFPDMPVMVAYGSGWEVRDFRGRKIVWHAGQLNGQSANVVLVPGLEAGFAILSNAEEGEALWALRHTLLDRLLGVEGVDWLDVARRRAADRKARTEKEAAARVRPSPASAPTLAAAAYAGRYVDSWYGAVSVLSSPAGLSIRFERTPKMEGRLEPWAGDTFRTRFADLNFEDALVSFAGESGRVSGATLKRLRPEGDFSFDYEHLRLRKAA